MSWTCLVKTPNMIVLRNHDQARAFVREDRFIEVPVSLPSDYSDYFFIKNGRSIQAFPKVRGGGCICSKDPPPKNIDYYAARAANIERQAEFLIKEKNYDEAKTILTMCIKEVKYGYNLEETSNGPNLSQYKSIVNKLLASLFKVFKLGDMYDEWEEALKGASPFMPDSQISSCETKLARSKAQYINSLDKSTLLERILNRKLGGDTWNKWGLSVQEPPLTLNTLMTNLGYLSNENLYEVMLALVVHEYDNRAVTVNNFQQLNQIKLDGIQPEEVPITENRCKSMCEWVAFFPSETSYVGELEESQDGFMLSQPLDYLQCSFLYSKQFNETMFSGTLFFPKLFPEYSDVFLRQRDMDIMISGSLAQSYVGLKFVLKSLMCDVGLKMTHADIAQFCRETYMNYESMEPEKVTEIRNNEPGNYIIQKIDLCYERTKKLLEENPEMLSTVHFKYFKKVVANLNILHDVQPTFELIQNVYENQRFFGFYMPFQNLSLDDNGKPMFDGAAHGPNCALHTNAVYETMKRMCLPVGDGRFVSHIDSLWEVTKLLGTKRIITCQDSGKKDGGTRRLIPLLMYYTLSGGHSKTLKFIDSYWKDDSDRAKAAVLDLMNPRFRKKPDKSKMRIYKSLPGYVETMLSKSKDKMTESWSREISRQFSDSD